MLKLLIVFLLVFSDIVTSAQSAEKFLISGKVISANSGMPIIGGSVMIDKNIGTTTDTTGQFSIYGLRQGTYKLSFRCLDYHQKDTAITIEGKNLKELVLTVSSNCKSYNQQKALKDLKKNKATLFANSKTSKSDQTANKQFKEKYGISFEFNDFGLPAEDCMLIYNRTVFEHLDSKFGKQWRDEIKVNVVGLR